MVKQYLGGQVGRVHEDGIENHGDVVAYGPEVRATYQPIEHDAGDRCLWYYRAANSSDSVSFDANNSGLGLSGLMYAIHDRYAHGLREDGRNGIANLQVLRALPPNE